LANTGFQTVYNNTGIGPNIPREAMHW